VAVVQSASAAKEVNIFIFIYIEKITTFSFGEYCGESKMNQAGLVAG
jgi:hypothetical protein